MCLPFKGDHEGRPYLKRISPASLDWLNDRGQIHLLSYVVMPDHIHVLFALQEGQELSKVMQQFGAYTGREIAKLLQQKGSVWQEGFYDRALRNETELELAYKYIALNPLEAGFVKDVREWPWLYPYP